ncbi:MAG: hypothetical protein ACKO6E_08200, partial [Planctomycetota bacterium]
NPLRRLATSAVVAVGILSAPWAPAAVTTFTDSATFSASLPTGNYVNNTWNGLDGFAAGTQNFSGGTPTTAYTARNNAGEDFFVDTFFTPPVLSTANGGAKSVITFDFTGSNSVYSVGGGFVVTNAAGTRLAGPTLGLAFWSGTNGTGTQLASATVASTTGSGSDPLPFFGLTSTDPIGSLVVTPSASFTNINNFITAVPEPSSVATTALAVAALAGATLQRRRRA